MPTMNTSIFLRIARDSDQVKLIRWRGGQHPTLDTISRKMTNEGLRPYSTKNGPNTRIPLRSHGYTKVMYCVEGTLEVTLPDLNQNVTLRPGDCLELPRGVRHAMAVGSGGALCVESARNQ